MANYNDLANLIFPNKIAMRIIPSNISYNYQLYYNILKTKRKYQRKKLFALIEKVNSAANS